MSIILPFDIAAGEREQAAGTSWVDIVAQSDTGETVLIENQLETSDHDHLGKAITYLSATWQKLLSGSSTMTSFELSK